MNDNKKFRLAIFASGNGTNAEAIMSYFQDDPQVVVSLVLSNNPTAFVLERARKFHVPARVFDRSQFRESDEILRWLKEAGISHIVLAGFLWLVPKNILVAYPDRIINIHPSILPKFGGKGMYGSKVHEAVKSSGEPETGITIHVVNENFDEGKILFQAKCRVESTDTHDTIAMKVHALEHEHYPRVIKQWAEVSDTSEVSDT